MRFGADPVVSPLHNVWSWPSWREPIEAEHELVWIAVEWSSPTPWWVTAPANRPGGGALPGGRPSANVSRRTARAWQAPEACQSRQQLDHDVQRRRRPRLDPQRSDRQCGGRSAWSRPNSLAGFRGRRSGPCAVCGAFERVIRADKPSSLFDDRFEGATPTNSRSSSLGLRRVGVHRWSDSINSVEGLLEPFGDDEAFVRVEQNGRFYAPIFMDVCELGRHMNGQCDPAPRTPTDRERRSANPNATAGQDFVPFLEERRRFHAVHYGDRFRRPALSRELNTVGCPDARCWSHERRRWSTRDLPSGRAHWSGCSGRLAVRSPRLTSPAC
jgi:hypothetical protein